MTRLNQNELLNVCFDIVTLCFCRFEIAERIYFIVCDDQSGLKSAKPSEKSNRKLFNNLL